jgi:transcriptional regulator with PAS, ATPase and Fis domain
VKLREGNTLDYDKYSKISLSLGSRSPHYQGLLLYHCMALLSQGRGTDLERDYGVLIDDLAPLFQDSEIGNILKQRLTVCHFINSALTGDWSTARRLLTATETFAFAPYPYSREDYECCKWLVKHAAAEEPLTALEPQADDKLQSPGILSTRALLAKDPKLAMEWARSYSSRSRGNPVAPYNFNGYTLIRAELSSGNMEAARRLIHNRQSRGCYNYMDSFFLFRVEALAGNRTEASAHFAEFQQNIYNYKANGRFDLEVKLACELKPSSLMEATLTAGSRSLISGRTKRNAHSSQQEQFNCRNEIQIVYRSEQMQRVMDLIRNYADQDAPVLITGETGTGKELIAKTLHQSSGRAQHPYVAVNCGAISETLIESELFGHKAGSFTGAASSHSGLFREAGAGSLFLDEISSISLRLQVALLRVLESEEVRPVGSSEQYRIKCRIVAATNMDLAKMVASGQFRRDLLYRLQRLDIRVPPLRERHEDIIAIAQYFLDEGRPAGTHATMSPGFLEVLARHEWPGNVRELRNTIERLRLLNSDKLTYDGADLDDALLQKQEVLPKQSVGTEVANQEIAPPMPVAAAAKKASEYNQPGEPDLKKFLREQRSPLRHVQRLKEIFEQVDELRVQEAAQLLQVSTPTASRYLRTLAGQGFIERIEPTSSTRTHYYAKRR